MDNECFLHACELVNANLVNLDVNRAFNSIGSNVFFEFGKGKEIVFKNGRKSIKKEWVIWISDASWRISKKGKYIVGSGDSPSLIQSNIQKLLGKRFQSLQVISQFLDVEFNFEDDYQITTFFNLPEENQWTLFLPDQTNIEVNCSNYEAIENVQDIAKHFRVIENLKKLEFPQQEVVLTGITYDKHGQPTFHFENETAINLENCTWRLEKDKNYLVGYLDDDQNKIDNEMCDLIGKKLKQIDVFNSLMDARLQFEDQYVLKTFTCYRAINQWKICSKNTPLFSAIIQMSNS